MKLGLQNLSADPILITLGTSGSSTKGYVVLPNEYTVVPAGVQGCFVQTVSGDAVFIVGSQPVLIKNRQITFTGAQITAQLFESPTLNG